MSSKNYWEKRELEQQKKNITDEKEYDREIKKIYQETLDAVQAEIDAFYGRYASKEDISLAEAKKRVSKLDIAAYERKAKRYVRERNFSKEANEEMRLYNLTMKVNRLEMLKANIGLDLIDGHDKLQKYMGKILKGRTEEELARQAGILGKTIKENSKRADSIVNASFHNAKFSDRIWMYQDLLKGEIAQLLKSGMIQGKNPRLLAKDLKKIFDAKTADAERLMRTEMARVQTEAQKQSFIRNGFKQYTYLCLSDACPICQPLNEKHYDIEKMMPGLNAPPMHPNCRCSIAAYEDSDDYEAWLDFLDKGGTTAEWNNIKDKKHKKKNIDDSIFSTMNATKTDSIRPKSIMKEMKKSKIGQELLEYLEKENVPVNLCYGVDNPNGWLGVYDPFEDAINIYCDLTKTTKATASAVIHEAMHRKLRGVYTDFEEEFECYKAEVLHQKGELTENDKKNIIEHIKKYYPEFEQG